MALADLELDLQATVTDSCSTITLKDTVGTYSEVNNTGGWGGATLNPADVATATLFITDPNGVVTEIDITATVTGLTISGDDTLATGAYYTVDGKYEFKVYIYTVGKEEKNFYLCSYLLCNVRCCIDTLWANFAADTVSADCGCTSSSLQQKALNAEAIFKALCAAAACSNTATRDALLIKLQRVCNLENCNCN